MPTCSHEWDWFEARKYHPDNALTQRRVCRLCKADETHSVCRSGIRCVHCADKPCACPCHAPKAVRVLPSPPVPHAAAFAGKKLSP